MRPVRSILIFFAAIFIGGALAAPLLYQVVHALPTRIPGVQWLAEQQFRRYLTRSFMVIAVAGMWPFLRSLGIRSWADAGLGSIPGQKERVLRGFGVGLASMALIVVVALAVGARQMTQGLTAGLLAKHVLNAGLAAVFVPVIEELFFRGALMGALRKQYDWRIALVISSFVYSLLHFYNNATFSEEVTWSSGLALLPRMMRGFGDAHILVPGFFTLFLVGLLLGIAFQRTGNLYFSIGLHAGWIFWLKSYEFLTVDVTGANAWFWGTRKLIDGWLAFIVLALLFIPYDRLLARSVKTEVKT